MSMGCVCDSSWPVGLGAGERQEPEWFGADCSLRKYWTTEESVHMHTSTNVTHFDLT